MIRRVPALLTNESSRRETACRLCGADALQSVLSLGAMPLANSLLKAERLCDSEPVFPLELAYCPACRLVQITETVAPELLYRDYVYASSYSDTFLRHARMLAERLTIERQLRGSSLVVEIASNDGYLLRNYVERGVPVLGIEPARNIANVARERGVPTRDEFFTAAFAEVLAGDGVAADVIHANNVLAHVPDLNGFVAGLRTILAPEGAVVIEVPYVVDMIDQCEFDTIYHEHLCYFSLTALDELFRRNGLEIYDVERWPIHGGSLRIFARHATERAAARERVDARKASEQEWEGVSGERYELFGRRVTELVTELGDLLKRLHETGATIAAYGASAKGSTLLNALRLPTGWLQFVADRSPLKQGKYTPGTRLPIVPAERLAELCPDYTLLLTWNFADEILAQQTDYRRQGGRFIVPVPHVSVI